MSNRLYNTSYDGRQSHRLAEEWEGSRRIGRANGESVSGSREEMLTDVLRIIQHDWPQLQKEDCNPITTALELLDESSVGKATKYDDFEELRIRLQRTLQNIVNEHFEGFTTSIATFNGMSSAIQISQAKVKRLREQLVNAKSSFSSTQQPLNLTELSASSKSYDEKLQQLEQIQKLQQVPDLLESQISQKHFLKSVDTLQTAMQTITSKQMMLIPALTDLRAYLKTQVATLTDIMVEELHNHLYLKSPYCDSRWQAYTMGQEKMRDTQQPSTLQIPQPGNSLEIFLSNLEKDAEMTGDLGDNPEIDSFAYIRVLLESLSGLNKLPECMNTLNQRMPIELYRLVDKTITEVEQRHASVLRAPQRKTKTSLSKSLRSNENDSAALVLKDFLWTLYSKFDALLQGHRVIHDVQLHITEISGKKDGLTYSFLDVWKPIQSEVSSLMHDYLNEDSKLKAAEHSSLSSINTLFAKKKRDKSKPLFKLDDIDSQSTEFTKNRHDLDTILQNSVPGLISNPNNFRQMTRSKANSAAGHAILVEPNGFNTIVILKPTFAFVERVAQIAPKRYGR